MLKQFVLIKENKILVTLELEWNAVLEWITSLQNTKEFINHIKKQKVPSNYKMISLDVISLFTNVPIDAAIDIILKRIYKRKEIRELKARKQQSKNWKNLAQNEFILLY